MLGLGKHTTDASAAPRPESPEPGQVPNGGQGGRGAASGTASRAGSPTLFRRLAVPLILVMAALALTFYCATIFGGVLTTLNQNAEDVLKERISTKCADIGTTFSTKWTDLSQLVNTTNASYNALMAANGQSGVADADTQKALLDQAYPKLVSTLRSNGVSGVFLIMSGSQDYQPATTDQSLYGVGVRDYDPTSSYTDKEDLMVVRCPSSMMGNLGCSIDSHWEATYSFDGTASADYFYKPLEQAYLNPTTDYDNLAYLSGPHALSSGDRQVVSYSVPLFDANNHPYAVLGIELTCDYLKTFVPSASLYSADQASYALAQYDQGSTSYRIVAENGTLTTRALGSAQQFSGTLDSNGMLSISNTGNDLQLVGYVSDITIYNHNTPFEGERLALVGIADESALYGTSNAVHQRLIAVTLIVLAMGAIAAFFICRRIVKPITKLSAEVRSMDPDLTPQLDRLNISEIDDLVLSIDDLGGKVNRNMVRTEFFSRMSHDMRTPMNAIIGFSSPEITSQANLQQLGDYMDKINSSGTYLLGLINEVLDMTKIESERMKLRLEPVSGIAVWQDVVTMINEVAAEQKVTFTPQLDSQDCWFMADRQRLNQILMNLLGNAVKFTPEGGTVAYEVKHTSFVPTQGSQTGTVTYQVTIADTGRGMGEQFQREMYEAFAQEVPDSGGTGLGLAITKQIVDLMSGTLACESQLGQGTTFTINLTFDLASDAQVHEQAERAAARRRQAQDDVLRDKRVLLCEDHPLNAQIAIKLLDRRKMTVTLAHDGAEGLKLFEESHPGFYDAVLMDIRMPIMDGLETTRAIRALDRPDATQVPIIAMTANAFAEDVEQSQAAGMNDHLSKPVDPTILYVTLEKYLHG